MNMKMFGLKYLLLLQGKERLTSLNLRSLLMHVLNFIQNLRALQKWRQIWLGKANDIQFAKVFPRHNFVLYVC